jgi:hypothetical protein
MFVPTTDSLDVDVQEYGGKTPDIKGIVDIDMLHDQLLGALRVSKTMLGITSDLPGGIGENASRRISINFAKNARRIQDGVKQGLMRLCQIHLAYRGLNPDPQRFNVHFGDISTAEEEELKSSLKSGVEVVGTFKDLLRDMVGDVALDNVKLLNYLVDKFIKLDDFNVSDYLKGELGTTVKEAMQEHKRMNRTAIARGDLLSYLPTNGHYTINENFKMVKLDAKWESRTLTFHNEEGAK